MDEFEIFRALNGGAQRPIPLATIDPHLAAYIGAIRITVLLSPYTARKLRFKHRIEIKHLRMLQIILDYGCVRKDRATHLVFVYQDRAVFGCNFKAVVKAAKGGTELYLESFHRVEARRVRALLKRGQLIRDWPE